MDETQQTDSTQPASQTLFDKAWDSSASERFQGRNTVSKQVDEDHQLTMGDRVTDLLMAPARGVTGLGLSLGKLGSDISQSAGGPSLFDRDELDSAGGAATPQSFLGHLTKGITQFTLAGGPVGSAFKAVTGGAKLGFLGHAAKAGVTDFVAFQDNGGRLADAMVQSPYLNNVVTRFLASDPNDSWATSRLKNALEGFGLGMAMKGFGKVLGGARNAIWGKTIQAAESALPNETKAAVRASPVAQEKIKQILQYAPKVTPGQAEGVIGLHWTVGKNLGYTGEQFDKWLGQLKVVNGENGVTLGTDVLAQMPLEDFKQRIAESRARIADKAAPGNEAIPGRTAVEGNTAVTGREPVEGNVAQPVRGEVDGNTGGDFSATELEPGNAALPIKRDVNGNVAATTTDKVEGNVAVPSPAEADGNVGGIPPHLDSLPKPTEQSASNIGETPLIPRAADGYDVAAPGAVNSTDRQFGQVVPQASSVAGLPGVKVPVAEGTKGLIDFTNGTQAILHLFKNSDVSTLLHESFHFWRRFGINADNLDSLAKSFGVSGAGWTRQAEESAARAFERYFFNGQAPTKELQGVFARASNWMKAIYKSLVGSPIEQDVHPDVSAVFDRMLGKDAKEGAKVAGPSVVSGQGMLAQSDHEFDRQQTTHSLDASGKMPDDVKAKVIETMQARLNNGYSVVNAGVDSLRTHINWDRLNIDSGTEDILKTLRPVLDPIVSDAARGVETLGLTKNLALQELQQAGADPRASVQFIDELSKEAKGLEGLASRLVGAKMLRNTMAQEIYEHIGRVSSAVNGDDYNETVKDLMKRVSLFNKLNTATQVIQIEGARVPSAGRITTDYAKGFDVQAMTQAVEDHLKSGGMNAKQLIARLQTAAGSGDGEAVRAVLKPFEEAGRTVARRALNMHNEFWMAQLLNSTKGWATKIVSDTFNTIMAPAERMLGGTVMSLLGKGDGGLEAVRYGYRTYTGLLGQFADFFQMNHEAMFAREDNAFGNAAKSFTREVSTIDAHMTDSRAITATNAGISPTTMAGKALDWAGYIIRTPSRVYSTIDEFAKNLNYRAALRSQALEAAEKQGITNPNEYSAFLKKFIDDGFDPSGRAINEEALAYAKKTTFSSDLKEGTIGNWVRKGATQMPLLKLLVPFIKVPTNIFRTAVEYTPGLNMLQGEFRDAMLGRSGAKAQASAIGRASVGIAFWGTVAGMAASGRITGDGPSDPAARSAWMATGAKPRSFKITKEDGTDEYISYERMEPWAMILGMAADFHDASGHMTDDQSHGVATAMTMAVMRNLTSKSYFNGLNEFLSAMHDPDRFGTSWLKNRASSYVAPVYQQLMPDQYMRDARSVMDAVKRKIPGLSETLPPKRNSLGEPIMSNTPSWSPFGVGQQSTDPVHQHLAQLESGLPMMQRHMGGMDLAEFKNSKGQDAYDRSQELVGQVKVGGRDLHTSLTKLFASDWWKNQITEDTKGGRKPVTTDPSMTAVHQIYGQYHRAARDQTVKEYPEVGAQMRAMQHARTAAGNTNIQGIINFR